jgi:hypothetical protein
MSRFVPAVLATALAVTGCGDRDEILVVSKLDGGGFPADGAPACCPADGGGAGSTGEGASGGEDGSAGSGAVAGGSGNGESSGGEGGTSGESAAGSGGAGGTAGGGNGGSGGTAGTGGTGGAGGTGGDSGNGGTGGTGGTGGDSGSGGDAGSGGAGAGGTAGTDICPTPDDAVGDPGWTHHVIATATAVYCATFEETRTLKQELEAKAKLLIAEGTYEIPDSGTDHAFALPLCLLTRDAVLPLGTGTASHSATVNGEITTHRHEFAQPVTGSIQELQGEISFAVGAGDPLQATLDGSHPEYGNGSWFSAIVCENPDECYSLASLRFDSCTHDKSTLNTHQIEFSGGSAELHLRLGVSMAGTEPGAFVRAFGSYSGTPFDQTDYFDLIYNPSHHHFTRDFVLLFDAPIDGACGLELSAVEPWYGTQESVVVYTVDCELNRLQELSVTKVTVPQP